MKECDSVRKAQHAAALPGIVTGFVEDVSRTLRCKMIAGVYSGQYSFGMPKDISPQTWPSMIGAVTEQLVAAFKSKDWDATFKWDNGDNYIELAYTIK